MSVVVSHRRLNEQAERVLRFMVERGGVRRRDGLDGICALRSPWIKA